MFRRELRWRPDLALERLPLAIATGVGWLAAVWYAGFSSSGLRRLDRPPIKKWQEVHQAADKSPLRNGSASCRLCSKVPFQRQKQPTHHLVRIANGAWIPSRPESIEADEHLPATH